MYVRSCLFSITLIHFSGVAVGITGHEAAQVMCIPVILHSNSNWALATSGQVNMNAAIGILMGTVFRLASIMNGLFCYFENLPSRYIWSIVLSWHSRINRSTISHHFLMYGNHSNNFFIGIMCGKPVDNINLIVGINATLSWAVNSPCVDTNVLFVTPCRLGKETGFYPHCKNYQFDEIAYIWI